MNFKTPENRDRLRSILPKLTGTEADKLLSIPPRRWGDDELGTLQLALLAAGLTIIADAIGSLMFDKVELVSKLEVERQEAARHG